MIIAPWISTRVYHGADNVSKAILLNNKDQELLTLDGPSADLWELMLVADLAGEELDAKLLAAEFKAPLSDVIAFFDELATANILSSFHTERPHPPSLVINDVTSFIPKIGSDGYTELAPGGSNLALETEMQEWAGENGFLWAFTWEVTYRCNESCVHCFNPGASHQEGDTPNRKTNELTTPEAFKLLDELASLGVFRLLLTGGEVFLRKDIFEILAYAQRKRFAVTIYTNGVLLDDAKISRIVRTYPSRVELSIYSPEASVHDSITRLKNSWSDTVNTAKGLAEEGVLVSLKLIAMNLNANHIQAFNDFCNEFGLAGQVDYNLSSGVDGSQYPLTNLSMQAADLIVHAMSESSPLFVGFAGEPRKYDPKKLIGQRVCGAGVAGMALSPDGNIYPCNSLPITVGTLKNETVSSVWKSSLIGKRLATSESHSITDGAVLSEWQSVVRGDYEVCGTFERCGWCQKCPGMAFLETGSELKPSTTNCRNAAARMIAYDFVASGAAAPGIVLDMDALRSQYPDEIALWTGPSLVEHKISLEELRTVLAKRGNVKNFINQ